MVTVSVRASDSNCIGHGGGGHFYKWLSTGGDIVSRITANNKLTNLYSPSRKRSPTQLTVLVEPKKWRRTTSYAGTNLKVGVHRSGAKVGEASI